MSLQSGKGFVNAHTHLYSGLVSLGMPARVPPPTNFREILERVWWRLDRALDERTLRAAARFYVAEALLERTVAVIDHHESPSFIEGSLEICADACQQLGMRAVLCYGATERNGGRDEARRGLAECRRFIESNRRPLVRGVVGLHASFTVSDETIREAGELCRELGTVLHLHVAEDRADVEDARKRGYAGPVERLLALGALVPGSILAHGVHLAPNQVRMASDAGCWFVQNPRSNRGNKVGYPRALSASSRVALGTDGFPANMSAEYDALVECAREHEADSDCLRHRLSAGWRILAERFGCARSSFESLRTNGATQPGAMRTTNGVTTRGAGPDGSETDLVVDGRAVIGNGQLLTGDIEAIRAEALEQAHRLGTRMRDINGDTRT